MKHEKQAPPKSNIPKGPFFVCYATAPKHNFMEQSTSQNITVSECNQGSIEKIVAHGERMLLSTCNYITISHLWAMFGPSLRSKSVYFKHKIQMFQQPNDMTLCFPSVSVQRKKAAVKRTRLRREACQLKRKKQTRFQACTKRYKVAYGDNYYKYKTMQFTNRRKFVKLLM